MAGHVVVRPSAEALAFALLFSVPVGVGVALAFVRTFHARVTDPMPLGAGLLAGVAVFLLVVAGAAVQPAGDA